jgi:hypothetical protein
MPGLNLLKQRGQDFVSQDLPRRWITKKLRYIDEKGVEQISDFVLMRADVLTIFSVPAQTELKHPTPKPALQGGLLVTAKVEIALLCKFLQKVF